MKMMLKFFIVISWGFFLVSIGSANDEYFYDAKNKRDPLLPLVDSNGVILNYDKNFLISDLNLEGIIYQDSAGSLAIVNGKILRVGDKVGKYIVDQIYSDKVVLSIENQTYELWLKKEK